VLTTAKYCFLSLIGISRWVCFGGGIIRWWIMSINGIRWGWAIVVHVRTKSAAVGDGRHNSQGAWGLLVWVCGSVLTERVMGWAQRLWFSDCAVFLLCVIVLRRETGRLFV